MCGACVGPGGVGAWRGLAGVSVLLGPSRTSTVSGLCAGFLYHDFTHCLSACIFVEITYCLLVNS